MIRFANENLLYLLALIPVFIFFYYLVFRWKRAAMQRFGNLELVKKLSLSASRKRQIWKVALLVAAMFFAILALARPQVGSKLEEVKREGVDLMIAIDVSASMNAQDIQPSRLDKARHAIGTMLDKLQGDRVGIIAFAGTAFVQCPLTLDYGAAKMFLEYLEPGMIPEPGTNLVAAIESAMKSFSATERKFKVLVLITDGEVTNDEDPLKMAEAAEREGVVIYTVGIGSPQGVPIPEYNERGVQTGFKKDRNGEVVVTKLDEVTLEKIALQTGGKYYRASSAESELDRIYDAIAAMEKKDLASLKFSQYEDRFQWPLGMALLLLVIEWHISERRVKGEKRKAMSEERKAKSEERVL
jgi:Ca-activated chloride channel family protein